MKKRQSVSLEDHLAASLKPISIKISLTNSIYNALLKLAKVRNEPEELVLVKSLQYMDNILTARSLNWANWDQAPLISHQIAWHSPAPAKDDDFATCELSTQYLKQINILASQKNLPKVAFAWTACTTIIRKYVPQISNHNEVEMEITIAKIWWETFLRRGGSYISIKDYNTYINWALKQLFFPYHVVDVEPVNSDWVVCQMPKALSETLLVFARQSGLRPSLFFKLALINEVASTTSHSN